MRAGQLADRLGTSSLIAQILLNRGITDAGAGRSFLSPALKELHDPFSLANLKRAAERIAAAIRAHEPIVIYGDYDVDGITATSILWHAITNLGGTVRTYIPHRVDEGYGLNAAAVAQLCDQGAKLIVTVDCGVTAVEPARVARSRGVDLIISDHHEWQEVDGVVQLPDCYAIVHPRLEGDNGEVYGNANLCGAGVAFKLAWGIGLAVSGAPRVDEAFRDFLVDATALAALGTIADVVPLVGENRILAHFGLGGLKASKLRGIRALIESANLSGKKLDSYDVGFALGPRLNACGRMGHASLAVEMMTLADEAKSREIAVHLEEQNRKRQAMERQILDQAIKQVTELGLDQDESRAIVLGGEGWHPGVIGIVASRLVDRFYRPSIMIALNNGRGQGSGRSIAGFHLAHALDACDAYLLGHGGHEMAAGLQIASDQLEAFREAFGAQAAQQLTAEQLVPELILECETMLEQITEPVVNELKRLEPFGQANRRPIFCVRGVQMAADARAVGKTGSTLQMRVRQGDTFMKCVGFGMGALAERLATGTQVDLAVEPMVNEFRGYRSVELQVRDVHWE